VLTDLNGLQDFDDAGCLSQPQNPELDQFFFPKDDNVDKEGAK